MAQRIDSSTEDIAQRLDAIVSHMPGLLYRCRADEGFPLIWIGGQTELTTGYTAEQLMRDENGGWTRMVHPDDWDRVMAELSGALAERRPWQLDFRINTAARTRGWVKGFGTGIYDSDGQLQALEGVIIDMTDQMEQKAEWERRAVEARERNVRITAATSDILETLQSLSVLSINASIEAARAGDAGRGFSVVAQEMNRLAARAEGTATAIRKATAHERAGAALPRDPSRQALAMEDG